MVDPKGARSPGSIRRRTPSSRRSVAFLPTGFRSGWPSAKGRSGSRSTKAAAFSACSRSGRPRRSPATDPARYQSRRRFSLVGASVERRRCRRSLGTGAGRGQLTRIDPDTGRPRPLADGLGASSSIAGRRRRRLARRPRRREEARPAHGPGAWERVRRAGARFDDILDRGRPRGRGSSANRACGCGASIHGVSRSWAPNRSEQARVR